MTSDSASGVVDTRAVLRDLAAWGVAAFAFSVPFDEITTIPGVGSPSRLIGMIALALGLIALISHGRIRFQRPTLFVVAAGVFVLWNLVTYFWSYQPGVTIAESARYVQLFGSVWLMSEFGRGRPQRLLFMQAFVLGNYVSFVITAYTVFVVMSGFRDVGPFNANQFSVILSLGIPMAALLTTERRSRLLYILNVAYPIIATFGVLLAASRSGLIVSLIALAVVPLGLVRLNVLQRAVLLVAAVAALSFSFGFAPQLFPELYANLERLEETGTELTTGTLTGRATIWRATLTIFQASPLVGIGSGATRFALVDTEIGRAMAVHNAYLSVAASTGLIGLLLFLLLLALAAVSALLAAPDHRAYLVVLAVALAVAMVPANSESRKDTWFVLGLLAIQRPLVVSVGGPRSGSTRLTSTAGAVTASFAHGGVSTHAHRDSSANS